MGNFRPAKIAMGKVAAGGGGRGGLRRAGQRYVSGRGGARAAANSAIAGRATTQRLGVFLGTLATEGFRGVVEAFQLLNLVGQPIEAFVAAITNAIAPAGNMLEDAAARHAASEAVAVFYEQVGLEGGDFTNLDTIDADTASKVLETSIIAYVYHRWLQDVGERIEKRSLTAERAVGLERQVRQFVAETVRLDFSTIDVLRVDWSGREGHVLVERLYRDAYSLLEE